MLTVGSLITLSDYLVINQSVNVYYANRKHINIKIKYRNCSKTLKAKLKRRY